MDTIIFGGLYVLHGAITIALIAVLPPSRRRAAEITAGFVAFGLGVAYCARGLLRILGE